MASPTNIRVNVGVPFPPLVVAAQGLAVTKLNGVWTVALNIVGLGISVPLAAQLATDYVLVYDSIAKTNVRVSLSTFGFGGALLQRATNASPIVVAANDSIINFNINAGNPTCVLPSYATRSGLPLRFHDAGGHAAAHPLTFTPAAGETFDGQAQAVMNTNYGTITFTPYNDGVNTGYAVS